MTVEIRAKRILCQLVAYHELDNLTAAISSRLKGIPLKSDENVLGIYSPASAEVDNFIVVTNIGIHVAKEEAKWDSINYSHIKSVSPPEKSESKGELTVEMKNGEKKILIISGGQGRFNDVYEFTRFLDRVRVDVEGMN